MSESRADEELVANHLAGDRTALAGIYDRYADSLYDTAAAMLSDRHEAADVMQDVFLIAAERLDQLRDPSRLKPWLFAILRNQVFTRTKKRGRTRVIDFSAPESPEMAAPIDPRAEGEELAYGELAEVVRSAAAGLDERDQLVLEYSLRQDLSGANLADALGVSLEQSYVVVHRMRERVERSLGAYTVARRGRKECPDLAAILSGWDGTFNVLIRKRVARHIEDCSTCERTKRKFAVVPLMGAAPALAAPPELRERVLGRIGQVGAVPSLSYGFTEPGGFPTPIRPRRGRLVLVAASIVAAVVLLGGGFAIAFTDDPSESAVAPTTPASASTDSSTPASAPTTDAPATTDSPETSTTSTTSTTTTVAPTTTTTPEATTTAAPTTSVPAVIPPVAPPTTRPPASVPPVAEPPATQPPVVTPPTTQPETTTTPTAPPPPPGQLASSTSVIDLGTTSTSGGFNLTNTGGQPLTWSLDAGAASPFGLSATGGQLDPGQSALVQATLNRGTAAEGALIRDVLITSSSGSGVALQLRAVVERNPTVAITRPARNPTCPQFETDPPVGATVGDESGLASVILSWSGPGPSGSTAMQFNGTWVGALDLPYIEGMWSYTVTATDVRGNVGTAQGSTLVDCPTPG